jgi:hypothetical protein
VGLVVAVVAIGAVMAVGVVVVLREAARLAHEPPPPVFDVDEAYEWVVEQLPDVVAATLTPDDVRRILDLQLEFFRRRGVSGNGSTAHTPGEVVISGSETVAYVIERAKADGESYLPEQVFAVIDTQMDYLRAIGALERVDPDATGEP